MRVRLSAPTALKIALGCFIGLGIFMYQRYEQSVAGVGLQAVADDVETAAGELRLVLAEAETSARGYAITGEPRFLEQNSQAVVQVGLQMERLKQLADSSEDQRRRLSELEQVVQDQVGRVNELVELRRAMRLDTARVLVADDAMRGSRERVAFLSRAMVDEARSVIAKRTADLQQAVHATRWLMVGLFVLSIALLLFAVLRIRRELRRRLEAEFALRTAYAQVEERVRQRTAELVTTNSLLRDSEDRHRQLAEQKDQALVERSDALAREQSARSDAELANRFRDRFLATVSHELRTPLNAIVGWTHLMQAGMMENSGRALEAIDRNAALQARLIDDLLDVSRMEQGRFSLTPVALDLHAVVDAAVRAAEPSARAKAISIECALTDDPVTILGDQRRLQQALSNLLANAIKFSPEHGTVHVRMTVVDGGAHLDVEDSGQGIDASFLPHVFQPFRQDATRPSRAGLGLGLAIARGIIERHQGTITVESGGRDRGTRFCITLPLGGPGDLDAPSSFSALPEPRKPAVGPPLPPRAPAVDAGTGARRRHAGERRRRRVRFPQPH